MSGNKDIPLFCFFNPSMLPPSSFYSSPFIFLLFSSPFFPLLFFLSIISLFLFLFLLPFSKIK